MKQVRRKASKRRSVDQLFGDLVNMLTKTGNEVETAQLLAGKIYWHLRRSPKRIERPPPRQKKK